MIPPEERPNGSEPHASQARELVPVVRRPGPQLPASVEGPLDVALGATAAVARPVVGAAVTVARATAPTVRSVWALVLRPPLVPEAWTAGALVDRLGDQGRRLRYAAGEDLTAAAGQTLDVVTPAVLDPVLDRVDITGIVLERVDLERIVSAVLDRMDLTEIVLQRVDLKEIVESAIDSIDLTEIVRTKVDLAGIAEDVIDEVDLPEIIRESSTGVAAEVVDVTRMQAVSGDELVSRWVDRVLLRRSKRRTAVPGAETEVDAVEDEIDAAVADEEKARTAAGGVDG
ncbi:MAG: hypothetical protein U0S36_10335 [Candidatus Nanopelagicales bacterium]